MTEDGGGGIFPQMHLPIKRFPKAKEESPRGEEDAFRQDLRESEDGLGSHEKHPATAGGGDQKVVFRGKKWAKRSLAAFLNLLVMPGCGSFVLGRRFDGVVQILLVVAGLVLKVAAVVAIASWINPVLGNGPLDAEAIAKCLSSEEYANNPPSVLGISAAHALVVGLFLVVAGWVYGLISVFLPIKDRVKKGEGL